jgi:hypothetical protein
MWVALGVALALAGCGRGGGTTTEGPTTVESFSPKPAKESACGEGLTRFVRSLDGLRDQLAVGLTYDQYLENVRKLQRAYGEIPVEEEPPSCVVGAGVPAEKALNQHVKAANAWGDCLAESCDLPSVEPEIKRRWARASVLITDAQEGLPR